MKVNNKNNKNKKTIAILLTSIVLVAAGVFVFNLVNNHSQVDQSRDSDSTQTQEEEVETSSERDEQNPATGSEGVANPGDGNSGGSAETPNRVARVHIPNYRAESGNITVNISIDEIWDTGRCVIEVEGPSKASATMDVFAAAQNSGCGPTVTGLEPGTYKVSAWAERNGERTNTETLTVVME